MTLEAFIYFISLMEFVWKHTFMVNPVFPDIEKRNAFIVIQLSIAVMVVVYQFRERFLKCLDRIVASS